MFNANKIIFIVLLYLKKKIKLCDKIICIVLLLKKKKKKKKTLLC